MLYGTGTAAQYTVVQHAVWNRDSYIVYSCTACCMEQGQLHSIQLYSMLYGTGTAACCMEQGQLHNMLYKTVTVAQYVAWNRDTTECCLMQCIPAMRNHNNLNHGWSTPWLQGLVFHFPVGAMGTEPMIVFKLLS